MKKNILSMLACLGFAGIICGDASAMKDAANANVKPEFLNAIKTLKAKLAEPAGAETIHHKCMYNNVEDAGALGLLTAVAGLFDADGKFDLLVSDKISRANCISALFALNNVYKTGAEADERLLEKITVDQAITGIGNDNFGAYLKGGLDAISANLGVAYWGVLPKEINQTRFQELRTLFEELKNNEKIAGLKVQLPRKDNRNPAEEETVGAFIEGILSSAGYGTELATKVENNKKDFIKDLNTSLGNGNTKKAVTAILDLFGKAYIASNAEDLDADKVVEVLPEFIAKKDEGVAYLAPKVSLAEILALEEVNDGETYTDANILNTQGTVKLAADKTAFSREAVKTAFANMLAGELILQLYENHSKMIPEAHHLPKSLLDISVGSGKTLAKVFEDLVTEAGKSNDRFDELDIKKGFLRYVFGSGDGQKGAGKLINDTLDSIIDPIYKKLSLKLEYSDSEFGAASQASTYLNKLGIAVTKLDEHKQYEVPSKNPGALFHRLNKAVFPLMQTIEKKVNDLGRDFGILSAEFEQLAKSLNTTFTTDGKEPTEGNKIDLKDPTSLKKFLDRIPQNTVLVEIQKLQDKVPSLVADASKGPDAFIEKVGKLSSNYERYKGYYETFASRIKSLQDAGVTYGDPVEFDPSKIPAEASTAIAKAYADSIKADGEKAAKFAKEHLGIEAGAKVTKESVEAAITEDATLVDRILEIGAVKAKIPAPQPIQGNLNGGVDKLADVKKELQGLLKDNTDLEGMTMGQIAEQFLEMIANVEKGK